MAKLELSAEEVDAVEDALTHAKRAVNEGRRQDPNKQDQEAALSSALAKLRKAKKDSSTP